MANRTMLGLCLGVSMALAFVPAQADDSGKGKAKGQAMQIKIDKKSGKKINADDDSVEVARVLSTDSIAASGIMPLDSGDKRFHADGSISAQLGLRQMKFATMSIDEDGNRVVKHETLESFEAPADESAANTEEE